MLFRSNPDYATGALRSKNRDKLNAEIATVIKTDSTASWIKKLNAAGVPCGPINTIDQVFADPQVQHLGMAAPVAGTNQPLSLVGQPVILSRTPSKLASPPPGRGQHTDEILKDLGLGANDIVRLRAANTI